MGNVSRRIHNPADPIWLLEIGRSPDITLASSTPGRATDRCRRTRPPTRASPWALVEYSARPSYRAACGTVRTATLNGRCPWIALVVVSWSDGGFPGSNISTPTTSAASG